MSEPQVVSTRSSYSNASQSMRRKYLVVGSLLMFLALLTSGSAQAPEESAMGGLHGSVCTVDACVTSTVAFSARNTLSGTTGHLSFRTTKTTATGDVTDTFQGDVICLAVVENTAILAGFATKGSSGVDVFMATVRDNGEPEKGISPDSVIIDVSSSPEAVIPPTCLAEVDFRVPAVFQHGNVVVTDDI